MEKSLTESIRTQPFYSFHALAKMPNVRHSKEENILKIASIRRKQRDMAQQDYLLRMFEEMSRAIAQIVYHRQIKDYHAAHDLIDEQLKQTLGMGSNFIRSLSDETLLAMLTTMETLNVEKCWLVALLLKAEGDLFEDEQDDYNSYYSYLKACNLFLEVLSTRSRSKEIEQVIEVEELYSKLADYEIPWRTQQLFFWYFASTGQYAQAEEMLFEMLEAEPRNDDLEQTEEVSSILETGEAFYASLLSKSDAVLATGNFSRAQISAGLECLHKHHQRNTRV